MSKVICDVCGTAYPETASQCPICNSAKHPAEQASAKGGVADTSGYVYVKGGRFSKKNVRKRNKRSGNAPASRRDNRSEEPSNAGLVVVAVLLILAIVAVVIYIGVHYFHLNEKPDTDETKDTVAETTTQPSETDSGVSCTGIAISSSIVELLAEGDTYTLIVSVEPEETTDEVSFASSDETVAMVSSNGIITAVGGGEAVITVSCGDQTALCSVVCSFGAPEPTTPEPTEPTGVFEFAWNTPYVDSSTGYGDATISGVGSSWRCYKTSLEIDVSLITWTSDDPEVCTIENGVVTATGKGKTTVHATYNGVTYTCIIRVS